MTHTVSNISDVHQYYTRSRTNQNVFIPPPRTNYGTFNVRYAAAGFWNKIPLKSRMQHLFKVLEKP